jgi:hypothetical protein
MHDDTLDTGVEAPVATDTAEAPAVQPDVQVEQVAPEAAQGTEGNEPEITATDTAEERLYAGKYKSVDDLEKSYTELQSKATKDAQEKAELARILNETFTTPEATAPMAQAEDTDSYGDYETPDPVAQKLATIERKDAVRDFIMSHPDANGENVNKILQSDPIVANINGYEAKLEYAYLKSKASAAPGLVAEAEKRASEQTQVKIAEKQAAQVEGARQQSQPAGEDEMSTNQLRSTLRDDKAFDALIQKRFPGVSKMRTRT